MYTHEQAMAALESIENEFHSLDDKIEKLTVEKQQLIEENQNLKNMIESLNSVNAELMKKLDELQKSEEKALPISTKEDITDNSNADVNVENVKVFPEPYIVLDYDQRFEKNIKRIKKTTWFSKCESFEIDNDDCSISFKWNSKKTSCELIIKMPYNGRKTYEVIHLKDDIEYENSKFKSFVKMNEFVESIF